MSTICTLDNVFILTKFLLRWLLTTYFNIRWSQFDLGFLDQILEPWSMDSIFLVHWKQRVDINLAPLKSWKLKFWFKGSRTASKDLKFLEQFNNRSKVQWYLLCPFYGARLDFRERVFFNFQFFGLKVFEPLQRPSMEDTWAHIHLKY